MIWTDERRARQREVMNRNWREGRIHGRPKSIKKDKKETVHSLLRDYIDNVETREGYKLTPLQAVKNLIHLSSKNS